MCAQSVTNLRTSHSTLDAPGSANAVQVSPHVQQQMTALFKQWQCNRRKNLDTQRMGHIVEKLAAGLRNVGGTALVLYSAGLLMKRPIELRTATGVAAVTVLSIKFAHKLIFDASLRSIKSAMLARDSDFNAALRIKAFEFLNLLNSLDDIKQKKCVIPYMDEWCVDTYCESAIMNNWLQVMFNANFDVNKPHIYKNLALGYVWSLIQNTESITIDDGSDELLYALFQECFNLILEEDAISKVSLLRTQTTLSRAQQKKQVITLNQLNKLEALEPGFYALTQVLQAIVHVELTEKDNVVYKVFCPELGKEVTIKCFGDFQSLLNGISDYSDKSLLESLPSLNHLSLNIKE